MIFQIKRWFRLVLMELNFSLNQLWINISKENQWMTYRNQSLKNENNNKVPSISKKSRGEVNLVDLPSDPGVRSPISSYHSNH